MSDRATWLANLTKTARDALFEYRRTSREAHPDAANAMDMGWDDAPALIRKMPRDFATSLDRGL